MRVQNPHPYPVDVPGGPVLSTAESADADYSAELAQKIAAGALVEVHVARSKSKTKESK